MKSLIGAATLFLAIGVGAALGQTDTPAPADQPAAGSKMTTAQKKAISKSCSDQANAKGLHGTARKKFRSECKKAGGKAPE
jgi:psiF repeat